jgi:hypothetical protein
MTSARKAAKKVGMKTTHLLVACSFVLVALGCNPSGTCIEGDEDSPIGARCTLDYPKRACDHATSSTFYKESKTAGMLRCKEMGFEHRPGGGSKLLFKGPKK